MTSIFGKVEDDGNGGQQVVVSDKLGELNSSFLSMVSQSMGLTTDQVATVE
jgi:hypothetical protein